MPETAFRLSPLLPDSQVPFYHQLAEQFRDAIRRGVLRHDDPIPKELDIVDSLGVSRATVRQAILQLVQEGFLHRISGKGTYVTAPPIEYDLLGFYNFKNEVERQHQELSIRLLSFEKLPMDVLNASLFGVSMDEPLVTIWRTLLVGGSPVLLERTTLPLSRVPGIKEEQVRSGAFLDLLTGAGLKLTRAKKYLEPRLADAFESHELGLRPGMPVLVVDRMTYGPEPNGPVLVRCVWTVRGDRCRHYISLDSERI